MHEPHMSHNLVRKKTHFTPTRFAEYQIFFDNSLRSSDNSHKIASETEGGLQEQFHGPPSRGVARSVAKQGSFEIFQRFSQGTSQELGLKQPF